MADISITRPCPTCGTLTTASGSLTDKELHGSCPRCSAAGAPTSIIIENPRYNANKPEEPGPAIEMGKHDPELAEKYFDATGDTGPTPFKQTGNTTNG